MANSHVSQVGSEESAGEEAKSSPDMGTTVAAAVPELQTGGSTVGLLTHRVVCWPYKGSFGQGNVIHAATPSCSGHLIVRTLLDDSQI